MRYNFQSPLAASNAYLGPATFEPCPIEFDQTFGPIYKCRYDFTLFFEQAILSSIPAAILLLISVPRIIRLYNEDVKTGPSWTRLIKLILSASFSLLQLALLVLWIPPPAQTKASLPSQLINFVTSVQVVVLSSLEHNRSIKPSSLLELFLFFSILLDIPQARTLFLLPNFEPIPAVFVSNIAVKAVLFFVEASTKKSYLKPEYQSLSPEETAGAFNRAFLWFLNGLFMKGSQKILKLEDLDPLDRNLSGHRWRASVIQAWENTVPKDGKYALQITVWKIIRGEVVYMVIPKLLDLFFTFMKPMIISWSLKVVARADEASIYEGHLIIFASATVYLGDAVFSGLSSRAVTRITAQLRSALVSLIYHHSFLLQDSSDRDNSSSMTLMSADVDRITGVVETANSFWAQLLQLVIGIFLLTQQLGWSSIMPLVVVALTAGLSSIPGKNLMASVKAWSTATQARMAVISSFIGEMKSIKMTGLTELLGDRVKEKRNFELKKLQDFAMITMWVNVFANIPGILAPAVTFMVYSIQAYIRDTPQLDTATAFTSLALISLVTRPAVRVITNLPVVIASAGNFQRVHEFLTQPLYVDGRIDLENTNSYPSSDSGSSTVPRTEQQASKLMSVVVHETGVETFIRLEGVTIKPSPKSDPVIIDASLSVKSQSITAVTGVVGSGKTTLLRAIIGEIPPETGAILMRTQGQLAYCAQSPWLPNGTIRQVIRAFQPADSSDPWYDTVVEACALKQDFSTLPQGDKSRIGSKGIALSGGQKHRVALARALYTRPSILVLDDVFSALDRETEKFIRNRLLGEDGMLRDLGVTVVMATHAPDTVVVLSNDDTSLKHGTFASLKEQGLIQAIEREQAEHQSDEVVPDTKPEADPIPAPQFEKKTPPEDLTRRTGGSGVFFYYFARIPKSDLILHILSIIGISVTEAATYIVLKRWTEHGESFILYGSIYTLLGLFLPFIMGSLVWTMLCKVGPETGRVLHNIILQTVIDAPMSFFTQVDRGSIITRFSNDIRQVDISLAVCLMNIISGSTQGITAAALVAVGSTYMVLTLPFLLVVLYFLQDYYLKTSRQLRLLDLENRGPLATHFLETLEGLPSLRAFGWQSNSIQENARLLNISLQTSYLNTLTSHWLSLVLDLIMGVMGLIVISLAMSLRSSTSPGLLGIALANLLSLNSAIGQTIKGYTTLETSLGAVARIREFVTTTGKEAKEGEDQVPESNWPSQGAIEIEKITASYNDSTTALQDVSLSIAPGQKVGICGRTGSGKSSLISVLLRLLDMSSGSIKIDSLDLATMPRETIRRHITSIPQDAVYLPGNLRLNADPWCTHSDTEIIDALNKVGLWSILEKRGDLGQDFKLDSLSKGQQQLLALARALLQRSKIVILDEATSSVDLETDKLMRQLIAEEFPDCTVITVAHRPDTILDSDMVVVLDAGQVVEFGPPQELMEREGSKLKVLVKS